VVSAASEPEIHPEHAMEVRSPTSPKGITIGLTTDIYSLQRAKSVQEEQTGKHRLFSRSDSREDTESVSQYGKATCSRL